MAWVTATLMASADLDGELESERESRKSKLESRRPEKKNAWSRRSNEKSDKENSHYFEHSHSNRHRMAGISNSTALLLDACPDGHGTRLHGFPDEG